MTSDRDFDLAVAKWLDTGSDVTPARVTDAVLLAARSTPQQRALGISRRPTSTKRLAFAVAALAVAAISVTAFSVLGLGSDIGSGPTPPTKPSVDLGIFEPVAGRIVYGTQGAIIGLDPAASRDKSRDPVTRVLLDAETGVPLGWSSDGTRLLLMRGGPGPEDLFVLHADGSEAQVTERPMSISGATISPDGSRVVFGAEGRLYAVDADGGPVRVLVTGAGMVQQPTFSPDGTRIAYTDGGGDHANNVWMVNADGSDVHMILSNERTVEPGHVRGLAWARAGDRIALGIEGIIYTFASDGSGFTQVAHGDQPYWSPDGSQVAFTAIGLTIANADGSDRRSIGIGSSGPWHPGMLENGPGG